MAKEVAIHFIVESIGAAIALYAYNYCSHTWHRFFIWFWFTLLTSLVTVKIVG